MLRYLIVSSILTNSISFSRYNKEYHLKNSKGYGFQSIVNYKYTCQQKNKFNLINCNHMYHSHSLPNPFYLPLLSCRILQPLMNPNECVLCVCVKIWHLFHICDRKYRFEINFCVYGLAECASISLILKNFNGFFE